MATTPRRDRQHGNVLSDVTMSDPPKAMVGGWRGCLRMLKGFDFVSPASISWLEILSVQAFGWGLVKSYALEETQTEPENRCGCRFQVPCGSMWVFSPGVTIF